MPRKAEPGKRPARGKRNETPLQESLIPEAALIDVRTLFPDLQPSLVAGIAAAGRGWRAGPGGAAAVLRPAGVTIAGLADSKIVPPSRRDGLAAEIGAVALTWGLGVVWPPEIDRVNILQATLKAMCHAASVLKARPAGLLIDGNQAIPEAFFRARGWARPPEQRTVVDGDARVPVISAASILAKTFRDALMIKLDRRYPAYGFARHKGYGSREHLEALAAVGPCPLHRKTFRGVVGAPVPERRQGSLV